jgi:hypothetical protein
MDSVLSATAATSEVVCFVMSFGSLYAPGVFKSDCHENGSQISLTIELMIGQLCQKRIGYPFFEEIFKGLCHPDYWDARHLAEP